MRWRDSYLARNTGTTTRRGNGIVAGVSLDVVSLPRLLSQQHDGDAGEDAAEETVEDAGLVEVLGVLVVEAHPAESSTAG